MKEYYSINEKDIYNNYYDVKIIENFQIFKGPDGSKGERGYDGIRGLQGLQGERGNKGTIGDTGDIGPVGYQGNEGIKGVQGVKGEDGSRGAVGLIGFRGEKGIYGLEGPDGFKGPVGEQGREGRQGFRGPQGPRGDKGAQAPQNVTIQNDNIGIGAVTMHGFVRDAGVYDYRAGMNVPDPRRGGSTNPALQTNFKAGLAAECPYNGYLTGFSWWNHIVKGEYITSEGNSTETDRITNLGHFNKTNQTGLPHSYHVDCKRVDVKFN